MINNTQIYFAKVKPNAIMPTKREEDAGYDIYICTDEDYIIIKPHETKILPTGIASACDKKYYFQIFERGSTGTKGIGQRCGVIDSSYRGEWFIPVTNHNLHYIVIAREKVTLKDVFGEIAPANTVFYPMDKAIAQAVLLPVPKVQVKEISYEELKNIKSERGTGNLGSSGK